MPNDTIRSSFSFRRCARYHYATDAENAVVKTRSQSGIPNKYSGRLFDLFTCEKLTAGAAIAAYSLFIQYTGKHRFNSYLI